MTVKTFILHDDAAVHRMVAYLRVHRKAAADRGHPLQCTIAPFYPKRSAVQVREMWGYLLKPTSEQARVNGVQYDADVWHTHLMQLFLPEQSASGVEKWQYMPDGTRQLLMSTGDLDETEMAAFLLECRAHVQQELGVELPERKPSAERQPDTASSTP